ncbi:hypothetical protein BC628DRAFT_1406449 [Trametes gibbosa]|nr:hypothetical protein BC628DRAFT_1406449 [Trametes gibbosa]
MASFIAFATQFFIGTGNRSSWTTWRASPPLLDELRYRSDPGSQQLLELRPQGLFDVKRAGLSITFIDCTLSEHDGTPQRSAEAPQSSRNLDYSPAVTDSGDIPPTCFSPNCDHSYCSPPRLMYSPASSSSIALDTPLLLTPSQPHSGNCTDRRLLSPFECHRSDDMQATVLLESGTSKSRSTLAERRGAKALALKRTATSAPSLTLARLSPTVPTDTPKLSPRILSPRTPDSASSSFKQRLVEFMRPATPMLTSTPCTPRLGSNCGTPRSPAVGGRDYFEDPFGRAAPPFYDDSYFFDAARARPHPDLFDLSIYAEATGTPARARQSWTRAPWTRMRTRVVDSTDFFDLLCGSAPPPERGDVNSCSSGRGSRAVGGSVHASFRSASRTPSPDRPAAPIRALSPPAPAPVNAPAHRLSLSALPSLLSSLLPSTSPPPPAPTPAETQTPSPAPPSTAASTPQRSLRPLLLPQKFARREIADAQASSISILQHATAPKLRALVLPAELARRQRTPEQMDMEGTAAIAHTAEGQIIKGEENAEERGDGHRVPHGETMTGTRGGRRRSQQLDDILTLLDQSGVLVDHNDANAAVNDDDDGDDDNDDDAASDDSDDSDGIATPPSLLSRPGSSSSFSVLSQSGSYDADVDVEAETDGSREAGKPRCDSRGLEDILELLDHPDDGAIPGPQEYNGAEGESEESICAYAM